MREAYARLVEELSRNGYAIVPEPTEDIPRDPSARAFVDERLSQVDVSIHLVGEEEGFAPEKSDPIVKLQLARAEARVGAATGQTPRSQSAFRRIIWAPEVIESDVALGSKDDVVANTGFQAVVSKKRQPQEALAKYGKYLPTDKLLGDNLSKFVDFLVQHLAQSDRVTGSPAEITGDDWVYVYHDPADTDYACDLTEALRRRGVAANLPALEGDPTEVRSLHQQYLQDCSAVVLCWARATEVWARARARELNWRKLGRSVKFGYRGLLAGPPPGERKSVFAKYPPANEIDLVVNVSEDTRPLEEAVDKFVQMAPRYGQ